MIGRFLLFAFALVTTVVQAADRSIPAFDGARFEALSQNDRLDFLLSGLRARENEMNNFSYSLKESISVVKANTKTVEPPFQTNLVSLQRNGRKRLFHIKRFSGNVERIEFWSSWDGSTSRSLYRRPEKSYTTGSLADSEAEILRDVYYNDTLGYRIASARLNGQLTDMTRSEWITHQTTTRGQKATVKLAGDSDKAVVQLILSTELTDQYILSFDPRRDLMLTKSEYMNQGKNGDFGFCRSTVTDAKQIDALWIPISVVQIRSMTEKDAKNSQYTYEVERFERNGVRDDDFRIEFPNGTVVLDSVKQIGFRITGSGTEPLGVYDASTGLATPPGESANETFKSAQPPFLAGSNWWKSAGFVAAISILVAMAILFNRRRQHAA